MIPFSGKCTKTEGMSSETKIPDSSIVITPTPEEPVSSLRPQYADRAVTLDSADEPAITIDLGGYTQLGDLTLVGDFDGIIVLTKDSEEASDKAFKPYKTDADKKPVVRMSNDLSNLAIGLP